MIGSWLDGVLVSDVARVEEGPQPRCDVGFLMKTLLRSGSSFDTSPPAGCCGGTSVRGEEPVRGV